MVEGALTVQEMVERLLPGLWITVQALGLSAALAACLAVPIGVGRSSSIAAVRWASTVYVEVFRGLPVIVTLFWLYFALPSAGVEMSALAAGVLALGTNVGALGAEIVRGALRAVPPGQYEAAQALNLSRLLRFRLIVLPQAFRTMLPSIGNLLVETLKGTALLSLVTVSDLTFEARLIRDSTGDALASFGVLLVVYFILATLMTSAIRLLERRLRYESQYDGAR